MGKVSVIVPARNELFLGPTVADLLEKGGDVEVIAVLDGYWPNPPLKDDPRLKILHRGTALGMLAAINGAAAIATGEWLMKCDAHCMFVEGYDTILQAECADNWMVIPRRYSLDAEDWNPKDKEPIDYHYYFYPYAHPNDLGLHARPWLARGRERKPRATRCCQGVHEACHTEGPPGQATLHTGPGGGQTCKTAATDLANLKGRETERAGQPGHLRRVA